MSVVGGDWENLKRFNLAEIYQPKNSAVVKPDIVVEDGANGAATEATTDTVRTDEDNLKST